MPYTASRRVPSLYDRAAEVVGVVAVAQTPFTLPPITFPPGTLASSFVQSVVVVQSGGWLDAAAVGSSVRVSVRGSGR